MNRGPRTLVIGPRTFVVLVVLLATSRIAFAQEKRPSDSTRERAAQKLAPVTVQADSSLMPLFDPYGFEARRLNSTGGVFIREQEIERRHATNTDQLIQGIPSLWVDSAGVVWVNRGRISYKDYYLARQTSQVAGTSSCIGAQVLVDRAEMPQPFSINEVDPARIRAIEIYRGPATTPPALRTPKAVCGTVAIWTK